MENRILNVLLTEIFGSERERGTYYIGGEEVGGTLRGTRLDRSPVSLKLGDVGQWIQV